MFGLSSIKMAIAGCLIISVLVLGYTTFKLIKKNGALERDVAIAEANVKLWKDVTDILKQSGLQSATDIQAFIDSKNEVEKKNVIEKAQLRRTIDELKASKGVLSENMKSSFDYIESLKASLGVAGVDQEVLKKQIKEKEDELKKIKEAIAGVDCLSINVPVPVLIYLRLLPAQDN